MSLSSSANMIVPVIFDDLHFDFLPTIPSSPTGIEDCLRVARSRSHTTLAGDGIMANALTRVRSLCISKRTRVA